jgi:uncharacterized protein YggE
MKKIWLVIISVALLVGIVGLVGCSTQTTTGTSSSQQQGIWVSGEGKITAVPDIALINLGVEVQGEDVAVAQAEANETMEQVIQALKDLGINEEDIQTTYFNISQVTQWDYDKQDENIIGYRVTNTVTVKVRQIDKVGEVIDAAVAAGGNLIRISGITFSIDDPSSYYEQARTLAIGYAKAKAEQLASEAGINLGKITYMSENSYFSGYNYVVGDFKATEAPSTTPISPGQLEITATVQIAYAID